MEEFEDWDDGDFMIDHEDLTFRSNSTTTNSQINRRDSHASFRSDLESLAGDDERHVHLPGDDEKSTMDAIALATNAGIPIPHNVPPSALMGGTIKRLGGRKIKKIFQEDWGDDLELPANGQALRIKPQDGNQFPEALRQVSGSSTSSPAKVSKPVVHQEPAHKENKPMSFSSSINLDKFRDNDDDDDVFGDVGSTIKAPVKLRPSSDALSLITPPTPQKKAEDDDFEMDLELPSNGKLQLTNRIDIPKTPALNSGDDFDWGEGSLGTRFGGTRRDAFSNRSSSVSALSPSIASSMTAESEDDALDGLVLPHGPLDLGDRLMKRRKQSRSPERSDPDKRPSSSKSKQSVPETPVTEKEDMLSGLVLGDGDVFGSGKATIHRNIKIKESRPMSPARPKTCVSITFSNKPVSSLPVSRLPRPTISHERSHTQSSLEPVSESGGPILPRPARRSQSRLGHSAQSSITSVATPTTPSSTTSAQPATPRRRELGSKASTGALRNEPTTTSAQLLRLKRSLPAMRQPQSPARSATRHDRPPSRTESGRPQSSLRPKTPVDRPRPGYEGSAAQARKNTVPFLPAGASHSQSQHVAAKNSRPFRRHDSDHGPDIRPLSRTLSRTTARSPSPRHHRNHMEKMATEPWQHLSKPRRIRQFGDGHELDGFDDLPTSVHAESKFIKQPSASGNRTNIRNKIYQNVLPGRSTPSPAPYSPAKVDNQPHFARDTAASRMAREASLAQRASPSGPLASLASQRLGQVTTRTNTLHPHLPQNLIRSKKSRKPPQQKPHLISNLNSARDSRVVNGMTYNPDTYRWEGNENALNAFDAPASSPSTTSLLHGLREKENATPRPVLISNMSSSKGVKRVGNMVFDPVAMMWLKVSEANPSARHDNDSTDSTMDEDDPFKGIADLEDKEMDSGEGGRGRVSDIKDEWLVGEEFDVGPEFIRRQHEEEDRWRKKCEKWIGTLDRDYDAWRWTIRDIITGS